MHKITANCCPLNHLSQCVEILLPNISFFGSNKFFSLKNLKNMFIDFRERGREGERNTDIREKHWLVALHCLLRWPGIELATHVCALWIEPWDFGVWDNAPINGATPARVAQIDFYKNSLQVWTFLMATFLIPSTPFWRLFSKFMYSLL